MSRNQPRGERNERSQNIRPRSGSLNQQRNFPGGVPAKVGGGASSATFNVAGRGPKKYNNNTQGSYSGARNPNVDSDFGTTTTQSGPHHQQPTNRVSDAPVVSTSSGVKLTDAPTQINTQAATKPSNAPPAAPTPNVSATTSESEIPKTPAKGDPAKSSPLQFGSISPGLMNGVQFLQVPALTSSAPPNLDEQKRAQARQDSSRAAPAFPIPNIPKQQIPKNAGNPDQARTQAQPVPRPKRDSQVAPVPSVTQTQKPAVHPMSGVPMQMPLFHQPQVPVQFGGPTPQIQSQAMPGTSLPLPLQMPLPMGNPAMQKPMFISGLQPYPMQSQGMLHQVQNFYFPTQMGHQQLPQLGTMGINVAPQFPQQQTGRYSGSCKSVKITHPETHEELRLDNSPGARSHPNVPPQSQPAPSFPPNHPMNFFPNSYSGAPIYFPAASSVPMNVTQVPPTSHPSRSYSQVTVKQPVASHGEKEQSIGSSSTSVWQEAAPAIVLSPHDVTVKPEDEDSHNNVSYLVSPSSSIQVKVSSDTNVVIPAVPRGKKKKKALIKKAKAAGTIYDLYLAYKGADEKKETVASVESIEKDSNIAIDGTTTEVSQEDHVPDDWEDAAEISPQLVTSKNESQVIDKDGIGLATILYSRDFLKFIDQCNDLPDGFEITFDIADALMASSHNNVRTLVSPSSSIQVKVSSDTNVVIPAVPKGKKKKKEFFKKAKAAGMISDTNVVIPAVPKGKKKKKEFYKKANAAGMISDLYLAYKGPEEKKETVASVESIEKDSNIAIDGTTTEVSHEDHVPDDWEDAAEISPQLVTSKNESQVIGKDGIGLATKLYSRDFLLKFIDQCNDLPDGFEFTFDIADALMASSHNNVSNLGKKKKKALIKKAKAAGMISDLYWAYKGLEEKKETVASVESIEIDSNIAIDGTNTEVSQEDHVPDDWDDAAEISPQLVTSKNESQVIDEDGIGFATKPYSRDFLPKFIDQCNDLPDGFEITFDMADALMASSSNIRENPGPERNTDRPGSGSRLDRRSSNLADDDRWSRSPGPLMTGRGDIWTDVAYGGNIVGFQPLQGGNYGVLRNPRAQTPQYAGGILSRPMQALGPQGSLQRSSSDFGRWQRGTAFQKGLLPSPQTPSPAIHKAEKRYEVGKITDEEQGKQRQLKAILNKLTPQNFDKLSQHKEVKIDNVVTTISKSNNK